MAVDLKQTGATAAPMSVQDMFVRAGELQKQKKNDEAIALYRRLVLALPDNTACWTNLGVLWRAAKKADLATACHRRVVTINPGIAGGWSNLGNALKDLERYEESAQAHRRAIEIDPDVALHWHNYAVCLRESGRTEEAIAALDRTLAINPDHVDAHWDRSLCNLALGRYAEARADYEWRWRLPEMGHVPRPDIPRWDGGRLDGRRLLLLSEQGFGDSVLALRYMPLLAGLGGHITLQLPKELERLVGRPANIDAVVLRGEPLPQADVWLPLMSLIALFSRDASSVPPPQSLEVPADAGGRALRILGHFRKRFRVGIVWSGSISFKNNHRRAVGLDRFLPLAELSDVQLFSLQKGPPYAQYRKIDPAPMVIDLGSHFRDFADTAAALREIDLVIMTDSSVAHLAGSLGVPVWNLLNFHAYWIYGSGGETTPWYDRMRLFRQPQPSDWDSVFADVRANLEAQLAVWRARQG